MIKKITYIFIAATVVIILAYDVWAVLAGGLDATISQVLLNSSKEFPVISFALGFVFGHIFWPNNGSRD
jgi:hypothetical protein